MKRLFFLFLVFAAFAAAYSGTSPDFTMGLSTQGASSLGNSFNTSSTDFTLNAVAGTPSGSVNPGVQFNSGGFGFNKAFASSNPLLVVGALPSTTCCGPYTFTSLLTDPLGRGINSVTLQINGNINISASLISGTVLNGTWSATYSQASAAPFTYQFYSQAKNGLTNNTAASTFSVVPASSASGGSATATPAPVAPAAPAAATASPPSSFPPTASTPPAAPAPEQTTTQVSPTSSVTGSFTDTSATMTFTATAGPSGATSVTEEFGGTDLHCADVTDGTVTISPAISSCQDGSIIATWNVNLAPQQTFTATVNVAKKLDQSVLSTFKAPKIVSPSNANTGSSSGSMPVQPTAMATSVPVVPSASSDYTLWYVVGGIVILGLLYYAFVSNKPKHKGL